ncbi:STAS domain-containing protein [Brevibacillus ginsengisoli]|uniref:STAS domain-containing protein n=1 Tax=Brevibacillus ginsengisoli TaxID=363854 RepID=UPI003CE73652
MHNPSNSSTVEIHAQNRQSKLLIDMKGKLIYGNTNAVKTRLKELVGQAEGYIIDLSHLQFIDSTGFGVLINFAKLVGIKKMAIVVKDEMIHELFTISKLNQLFPITSTVEEAELHLDKGYQAPMKLEDY